MSKSAAKRAPYSVQYVFNFSDCFLPRWAGVKQWDWAKREGSKAKNEVGFLDRWLEWASPLSHTAW
jgi:hypothetical protein